MDEAHKGTCTLACPTSLGSVPWIISRFHGDLKPIIIIEKLKPVREKNKTQK
jgi:hypothetical protein